jgi:hypothetical protein
MTVAVLLAGAASFWPNVMVYLLHPAFPLASVPAVLNLSCFAVSAGVGLWLLMPNLLRRSLAAMRQGRRRLIFDLAALLMLLFTALVWALSLGADFGVFRRQDELPVLPVLLFLILPLLLVPGYIYTFLFPARIFARHDRVPVIEAPARTAPGPAGPVAQQPAAKTRTGPMGTVFGLVGAALMVLSYIGFAHPLWIPSADWLGTTVEAETTVHAVAIGVFLMITQATRRVDPEWGAARRFFSALAVAALSAGFGYFASEPLARAGLPWVASYMVDTTPVEIEVVVDRQGAEHRRKACDRVLMVTLPEHPGTPVTLCGTPPAIWEASRPGDRLILSGPGTAYGLRPETVRRLP